MNNSILRTKLVSSKNKVLKAKNIKSVKKPQSCRGNSDGDNHQMTSMAPVAEEQPAICSNVENARDWATNTSQGNEDWSDTSPEEWLPLEIVISSEEDSTISLEAKRDLTSSQDAPTPGDSATPQEPTIGALNARRKRGHGPMQRKLRKERTDKLRKGEAYITAKGKCIKASLQRPVSENCRSKCKTKLSTSDTASIYNSYRLLSSREAQRQYLAGLCVIKPKARTNNASALRNRQVSVVYKMESNGCLVDLCKPCFLCVFGESRGFLNDIIKKKKETNSNILAEETLKPSPSV